MNNIKLLQLLIIGIINFSIMSVGFADELEQKVFLEFKKEAEQGSAKAQSMMGYCYSEGRGVFRDDEKAAHWFTKAAEQGDVEAQYNLALMYYNGDGVLEDLIEAYAWALHTAINGETELKGNLKAILTPKQIAEGQVRAKELQEEMDQLATTSEN